jgi:uracil-DNA glycosylase
MTETIILAHEADWGGWRAAARTLAINAVAADAVAWSVSTTGHSPAASVEAPTVATATFNVPRALVELAQTVIQAREPDRFDLLYRLLLRTRAGERQLLDEVTDPEVRRVWQLAQAVQRDTHRMHALTRFREIRAAAMLCQVAWTEPDHYILEANAAVFAQRFATTAWSIVTPYRAAHWNGQAISFTAGVERAIVPGDDALANYWRVHFSSFFDHSRTTSATEAPEMPRYFWRDLPRAATGTEPAPSPPLPTIAAARREAGGCRVCELWKPATQTVFGEGPASARLMFIGEQPGDQEDLAGRPFVGPAGQLLDTALAEAGIDRGQTYITNAVKHFKFEPRGKRRIHVKPTGEDIAACKFWLDLERQEIKPAVTVLLGASAAQAVLGRVVTISRERGHPIMFDGQSQALVTVHPSYLLRLPDEESRRREYAAFVADLRHAKALLVS